METSKPGSIAAALPRYDDLPFITGNPARSAWGLWGDDDELGTLNLLTPQRVAQAAQLVHTGNVFALNWNMELPEPPLFGRAQLQHTIKPLARPFAHDDLYANYNTQSSSHWDGLTHVGNVACECFYNGIQTSQVSGLPGTRNGIQAWARRGIAGRGVLLDYRRWAEQQGIAYSPGERHAISAAALEAVAEAQGVQFQIGDILLIRSGWIAWYLSLSRDEREQFASARPLTSTGIAQGDDSLRFLWDNHFAAIAGDSPACEAFPPHLEYGFMHETLLALWGMPIGEMFDLEALAAECAADRKYTFFFTSAPLNKLGGVASPPNALAIK